MGLRGTLKSSLFEYMSYCIVNHKIKSEFKTDLFYFSLKFNFYETARIQRACGLDSIVEWKVEFVITKTKMYFGCR